MREQVFQCDFGGGYTATIRTPSERPADPSARAIRCEWSRLPVPPKLMRAYIGWSNSVAQTLANEWGLTITQVYLPTRDSAEIWVFEPGGRPRLIRRRATN